jgi:hypothetical protein
METLGLFAMIKCMELKPKQLMEGNYLYNNRVEGDNLKMKKYCGASNPNIIKAITLLKVYEAKSHTK